jgi:hypothetical protein
MYLRKNIQSHQSENHYLFIVAHTSTKIKVTLLMQR